MSLESLLKGQDDPEDCIQSWVNHRVGVCRSVCGVACVEGKRDEQGHGSFRTASLGLSKRSDNCLSPYSKEEVVRGSGYI